MASAYLRHLPRFERSDGPSGIRFDLLEPAVEPAVQAPQFDPVAAAEERGRTAGFETAKAEMEAVRAEDRRDFDLRMAEARQLWAEETAAELGRRLDQAVTAVEDRLAEALSAILAPLVIEGTRERALTEARSALASALAESSSVEITITGPAAMIDALRGVLAEARVAVTCVVDDAAADVAATVDGTRIMTHLAAWRADLEKAIVADG